MMSLKLRISLLAIISFITLSCGSSLLGDEISEAGLYKNPPDIIASFDKNGKNYTANYVLAGAYRFNREPKNAILYYANSCFKSKFNYNLRIYPQPIYAFVKSFSFKSPYYADAVYNIALLFSEYGEHEYVVRFIDLMDDDKSILYRDAVLLKSKSLVRLSRQEDAIEELDALLRQYSDRESAALINIRLGSVYEDMEKNTRAAEAYLRVLSAESEAWHRGIAVKRLVYLREQKNVKPEREGILLMAGALFDSGEITKAGQYADQLLKEKQGTDAVLIKIRVLTVTRYSESLKLLNEFRDDPHYEKMLLAHANLLWDKRRKSEAIKNYISLAESADADIRRRVLTRIIFYLEERNHPEFTTYAEKYSTAFPGDEQSPRFLWMSGRYYLKQKKNDKAAAFFSTAIKQFPDSYYTACCRYWLNRMTGRGKTGAERKGFLAEMCFYHPGSSLTLNLLADEASLHDLPELQKEYDAALSADDTAMMILYHTLLFIKTGYTDDTAERVNNFNSSFISPYKKFKKLLENPSFSSRYSEIITGLEKYFAAGDTAAISREIRLIPEEDTEARKDINLAFTVFSARYGFFSLGTWHGFRMLDENSVKEHISLFSPEFARTLYPDPFRECADRESKKYGINRAVIYSMIKAESNFNHRAESPAGAVGLMQLMPATASGIAKELKTSGYDLKDPCTSIRFGTHYIAWLNRYYKGRIEYMVAGYNAGAGNVDKWIKNSPHEDLDLFSEFVPFYETRDYISRTKKFIIQYKSIYRW